MLRKWIEYVIVAVILSGSMACSSGHNRQDDSATLDSLEFARHSSMHNFYEEWRKTEKLELASMTVKKTVTTERTAWYKVGKRVGAYSFDVYLKAYIDMEKLRPEDIIIDEEQKTIKVKLPEPEVEIAGRSSDLQTEYEDIGVFRSRPDSRERAALKDKAFADFEREFNGNSEYRRLLLTTASRNAAEYFSALGEAAGYKVELSNNLSINKRAE